MDSCVAERRGTVGSSTSTVDGAASEACRATAADDTGAPASSVPATARNSGSTAGSSAPRAAPTSSVSGRVAAHERSSACRPDGLPADAAR